MDTRLPELHVAAYLGLALFTALFAVMPHIMPPEPGLIAVGWSIGFLVAIGVSLAGLAMSPWSELRRVPLIYGAGWVVLLVGFGGWFGMNLNADLYDLVSSSIITNLLYGVWGALGWAVLVAILVGVARSVYGLLGGQSPPEPEGI